MRGRGEGDFLISVLLYASGFRFVRLKTGFELTVLGLTTTIATSVTDTW